MLLSMVIQMNDRKLQILAQLQAFLEGTTAVDFAVSAEERCDYLLDLELGSAPLIVREFADYCEAFMSGVELGQDVVSLAETNPRQAG